MPTTYAKLMELEFPDVHAKFTKRDTMFYALSLGLGANPINPEDLNFVYEQDLQALPMMSVVLAHPGFWPRDLNTGLDWVKIVHGGQRLTMHQPLPTEAEVIGRSKISEIYDKGEGKGALIVLERTLIDKHTQTRYCTMQQSVFCRGDGGIGGDASPPPPAAVPNRPPDLFFDQQMLPQTALLYRLNGDMNPLHADPAVAAKAGFKQPILQGLATFGVAGVALIKTLCKGSAEKLVGMNVRFTAPVYPGETLRTEIWNEGNKAYFRVSVPSHGITVIDNGEATIA